MSARPLADRLIAFGFSIRLWQDKRIYLAGYGRTISAYIEPTCGSGDMADGARIVVESSWRSAKAGLHAMGVKHAILRDLYEAGLLTQPPPDDWRRVRLEERLPASSIAARPHPIATQ